MRHPRITSWRSLWEYRLRSWLIRHNARRRRRARGTAWQSCCERLETRTLLSSVDLNGADQAGTDYATTFTEDAGAVLTQDVDLTVDAGAAPPAPFAPLGPEFQVNTTTGDQQRLFGDTGGRALATDAAGNFVVIWSSLNQDGGSWGVYGRRYNASGAPLSGEFQVNTFTGGDQSHPSVAIDADGNFVITWSSFNQDGDRFGVYGRRYNASGAQLGGEFQVNTFTGGDQSHPSVAIDADGNFVITWSSFNQDGSGSGVYGQRYNASGAPLSGEFQVNTFTSSSQEYPSVAMDADGNFVVTWSSFNQDGSGSGVYGQRYNASGAPLSGEFLVNTFTSNDQRDPSVAMDDVGNFVVTWSSFNQDGSGWGIFAKQFQTTSGQIDAATVTISNVLDGTAEVLTVDTSGTAITANYASGILTLTGTDTAEDYQHVLRTVRYENSSQDPDTSNRIIEFVVRSCSTTSAPAITTLSVVAVNDAPLALPVSGAAVEDGPAVTGSFDADDVDSDDTPATLVYAITSAPSEGAVLNNNDGTFTFDPGSDFQDLALGETREVSFDYTARDTHGALSNTATVTITVTGTSDATTVSLSGSDLLIEDTDGGNTNDNLTLSISGTDLVITDPVNIITTSIAGATGDQTNTVTAPLSAFTGRIRVNTFGGDDVLTMDFSGGDFTRAIDYDAGSNGTTGDSLALTGGGTFADVTYNYTSEISGSIIVAGNSPINYNNTEPISSTIDATDVTLIYSAASETITITDAGSGQTTVDSTAGETSTFNNPSGTLTINAGDTGVNTVDVGGFATSYPASIDINGGNGGDTVNFTGDVTFAVDKSLSVDAASIVLRNANADIDASGSGAIELNADRNVQLRFGSRITTVNGDITINANTAGTASGNFIGIDIDAATIRANGTGQVMLDGHGGDHASGNQRGIHIRDGGHVIGGSNAVSVIGDGGDSSGNFNHGVCVDSSNARITSGGGSVAVTGTGGGAGTSAFNRGVQVFGGEITAGGGGTVNVVGEGGNTSGGDNNGVFFVFSEISSSGGNVSVTGTGGGGGTSSFAVRLTSTGTITTAANGGAITVTGDSMDLAGGSIDAGTDNVTLTQKSNGTLIDLGGSDVLSGSPLTLGLTDAEMDVITAGKIIVGNANSGAITISNPIDPANTTMLDLISGGVIGDTNTSAPDVTVARLTVDGNVAPGSSPGILSVVGEFTFADNDTFTVEIGGTTPGNTATDHDQLDITGSVTIGNNVVLNTSSFSGFTPSGGDKYVIINNDGTDAVSGTFDGLPEGATISNFLGSGLIATITYLGLDNATGNDIVLTVDIAKVEFNAASAHDLESSGGNLAVLLVDGALAVAQGIDIAVTGGSATQGSDFTNVTTVTIPIGVYDGTLATAVPIGLAILGDAIVEDNQTIELALVNPKSNLAIDDANSSSTTQSAHTYTIDNDHSATLMISNITALETDADFNTGANVTLNAEVEGGFDVAYSSALSTAEATDVTVLGSSLHFAGALGELQTITVAIHGDQIVEANETFSIRLGEVTNTTTVQAAAISTTAAGFPGLLLDNFGDGTSGIISNTTSTVLARIEVGSIDVMISHIETYGELSADGLTKAIIWEGDSPAPISGPTFQSDTMAVSAGGPQWFVSPEFSFTLRANEVYHIGLGFDQRFSYYFENPSPANSANGLTSPQRNGSTQGGTFANPQLANASGGAQTSLRLVNPPSVSATGTITNDDTASVTFEGDVSVVEGSGPSPTTDITFFVTLDNPVQGGFDLDFAVNDGTATAADDFEVMTVSPLSFSGNANELRTITVRVDEDSKVEADETYQVALGALSNLDVGLDAGAITIGGPVTGTIENDDAAQFTVSSESGQEDGGPITFTVTLSHPVDVATSVDVSTADGTALLSDGDYTPLSSLTLNFAAGVTTQTFAVLPTADFKLEPDETFDVGLLNVVDGGRNVTASGVTGTGTIVNDDVPLAFTISDVTQAEGNSGTTAFTFTVTLSSASSQTVTVGYATADDTATGSGNPKDYNKINSGTLTFAPGETSKTITVDVIGETLSEIDGTFFVNLSNPSNAVILDGQGIGTITNDDAPPILISIDDVTQAEGNSGTTAFTFTVTLSAASTQQVTVDYSTVSGTAVSNGNPKDFQKINHGTLTFAPGETSKTITVFVFGDTTAESNETFSVILSNGINALIDDDEGLGTILDDDGTL